MPNIRTYRKIYEVENWLRRICYTVYVLEYGYDWESAIPSKIKKKLDSLIESNISKDFLYTENDRNYFWNASTSQLSKMIDKVELEEHISKITGIENRHLL